MNSFVMSVRLNDEEDAKLTELASALGLSKSDAVRHAISTAWMSYNEQSDEVKQALKNLQSMRDFLAALNA